MQPRRRRWCVAPTACIIEQAVPFHPRREEQSMRKPLLTLAGLAALAVPLPAQTADEIIAKYLTNVGGMDKIQAVTTLRRTGKVVLGGGFEAGGIQESQRPNKLRQGFGFQGMTGVNAYDGKTGWKIEPGQGEKDPEGVGEREQEKDEEDGDL